ncbi:unnamed protein product [Sphagnum balticum]
MTGKRPRAPLRRTSSESSFIESGFSSSTQEDCSPLPEHPKEKLKPTLLKEPVSAAAPPRRLVIGFNPKPLLDNNNGNGVVNRNACLKAAASSATPASEKSPPSQRSGLESLLSMSSRERKVNEGGVVGLGIRASMMHTTVEDEPQPKTNIVKRENQQQQQQRDHVTIAIKSNAMMPTPNPSCQAAALLPYETQKQQQQSQSIPIHAPGPVSSWHRIGAGRPSQQHHRFSGGIQPLAARGAADGQGAGGGRGAALAWLRRQADDREGERDTFLLRPPSSFKSTQVVVPDVAAAAVHFLDACFFCKRHLVDGKDIYMYRGDKAFCSTECRSQQILLDERLENCTVAALKSNSGAPSAHQNRVVASGTAAAA